MPVKLRVNLAGPTPPTPFWHSKGLHALVLSWIQRADPGAAELLHSTNSAKPYTISPLWSNHEGQHFEISVLTDELQELLQTGAESHGEEICLGQQQFHRHGDIELCDSLSWAELLQTSPCKGDMTFQLLSPTAHHQPGPFRKVLPLPSPEAYFGSWLQKWNLFAPLHIDSALLNLVERHLAISFCKGHTQAVPMENSRTFIGFVGLVTFRLLNRSDLSAQDAALLAALSRLANFSGTGVATLRGMGQTRSTTHQNKNPAD